MLGEDVGVDGGVFRATDGLIERFGADRVIDTPLAESAIIGMSVGLAATGLQAGRRDPVHGLRLPGHQPALRPRGADAQPDPRAAEVSDGRSDALRWRDPPPGAPLGELRGLFLNTPGFKVVVPSNPYDAKGLLVSAIRDEDPVLFMEPKRIYRAFREAVPAEAYTVPLGKAAVAARRDDVTLISWGAMVRVCLDAAEVLARRGRQRRGRRSPDPQPARSRDHDRERGQDRPGGGGPRGAQNRRIRRRDRRPQINEHALLQLEAPVQRVAGFDVVFPLAQNEKLYLPSRERIVKAVETTLAF